MRNFLQGSNDDEIIRVEAKEDTCFSECVLDWLY